MASFIHNSIEYAFAANTANLVSGGLRQFDPINVIAIPELSNFVNTSEYLFYAVVDNYLVDAQNAAGSVSSITKGFFLDGVGGTATRNRTITNSGAGQSLNFLGPAFFPSMANTAFTVNSSIGVTGIRTMNGYGKVSLEYFYDSASSNVTNTRIKTVKIPVEGSNIGLSTSLTNLANLANQIPNLSTFLPEANVIIRDVFFECSADFNTSISTVPPEGIFLNLRFDGANTISATSYNTPSFPSLNLKTINKLYTNANSTLINVFQTSNLEVSTSNSAISLNTVGGILVVTYTYDEANTTTVLNSIQIPINTKKLGYTAGDIGDNIDRFSTEFYIQEPGPIELVQSGYMLRYSAPLGVTISTGAGNQYLRRFAGVGTTITRVGDISIFRRVDEGTLGGAGLSLSRGKNNLQIDVVGERIGSATTPTVGSAISGVLYLNYKSSKASSGTYSHNRTIYNNNILTWGDAITGTQNKPIFFLINGATPLAFGGSTATLFKFYQDGYYLNSVGFNHVMVVSGAATPLSLNYKIKSDVYVEALGSSDTYIFNIQSPLFDGDNESGFHILNIDFSDLYSKTKDDYKINKEYSSQKYFFPFYYGFGITAGFSQLSIETTITNAAWHQAFYYTTYHTISYTISGTISGSAGGTVEISAYRTDTDEEVGYTSRTGNGTYSIQWFDNTIDVYVVAYESSTLKGVSAKGLAGNTFDINLDGSSGGGGSTNYAYIS